MGWGNGSRVFEEVWTLFREYIPECERLGVCRDLIIGLERQDWDCEGDFLGDKRFPEFDRAYRLAQKHWKLKDKPCLVCVGSCHCDICTSCDALIKQICRTCSYCNKCCECESKNFANVDPGFELDKIFKRVTKCCASVFCGYIPSELFFRWDTTLESFQFDELDAIELLMALEDEFDISLSDEIAENWTTISDISDSIKTLL